MLNETCGYKKELIIIAEKKVKDKVRNGKIENSRAGELDEVLRAISSNKIELKNLQSIYKDKSKVSELTYNILYVC